MGVEIVSFLVLRNFQRLYRALISIACKIDISDFLSPVEISYQAVKTIVHFIDCPRQIFYIYIRHGVNDMVYKLSFFATANAFLIVLI